MKIRHILSSLWAKSDPFHPLVCHLLDAAAVCGELLTCFGCPDDLTPEWTMFCVGMHDIGKADPEFQGNRSEHAKILDQHGAKTKCSNNFRHEARSAEWFANFADELNLDNTTWRTIMASLRWHHVYQCDGYGDSTYNYAFWAKLRNDISEIIIDIIKLDKSLLPKISHADRTGSKLIGLTVLSDWISSNEEIYRYSSLDINLSPEEYWGIACAEAKRAVNELRFKPDSINKKRKIRFSDVWPKIKKLKPSQQALDEACADDVQPGLVIIEAPMGEGKTESAIFLSEYWRALYGIHGTYIALPTMATSNQMHGRYEDFLSRQRSHNAKAKLVHGMAWLIDDKTPLEETQSDDDKDTVWDWFNPSKRALLAPEGVGTVDQVMKAALNVKHGHLRLLGLSSKVLIIDEVHAYDVYMTTIIERLLEWCRVLKIPVILLSATLSKKQKERLLRAYGKELDGKQSESYPLITCAPFNLSEMKYFVVTGQKDRVVKIIKHPGFMNDAEKIARLAEHLVKNNGCACVIMNTVRQAQEVFRALSIKEKYLFHARFTAKRRNEIEHKVVDMFGKEGNRPLKAILVTTQVVEQSLDLDFDFMLTQLAPIDLMLQRIGRLRRHVRDDRPVCSEDALHILMPDLGKRDLGGSKDVYSESILLRTMAVLEKYNKLNLPYDFRNIIDACYGDDALLSEYISESELDVADVQKKVNDSKSEFKAKINLIPKPNERTFYMRNIYDHKNESDDNAESYFVASTRQGDETVSVVLLDEEDMIKAAKSERPLSKDMLKKIYLCKADIPIYWLDGAIADEGHDEIFDGKLRLKGLKVIPLKNGVWQGKKDGKIFQVAVDLTIGIELKKEKPE